MNTITNYLSEIESEYSRIRGKWSPLSPMDWQLAQKWEDSGIPLHIVLTAMSEVFRQFESSSKGGKINSLSYFTQQVEKQFATWSASQVGKNTTEDEVFEDVSFADETIARLETIKWQIINNAESVPSGRVCDVLIKVESVIEKTLLDESNIEKIESILQEWKLTLDETILKNLSENEYQKIVKEIKQQPFQKGFASLALDMQDRLILKQFYKKYYLPELTLYEL